VLYWKPQLNGLQVLTHGERLPVSKPGFGNAGAVGLLGQEIVDEDENEEDVEDDDEDEEDVLVPELDGAIENVHPHLLNAKRHVAVGAALLVEPVDDGTSMPLQ
jgi:hypothetical protein